MKVPISVIILTWNESVNIEACLDSIAWSDDVVIVDSASTDDTVAKARRLRPDVSVFDHAFKDFGDQRNWAIDNTSPRNEWILFLDADEHCTPELASAMARAVANGVEQPAKNNSDTRLLPDSHTSSPHAPRAMRSASCSPVGYFLCARNYFLGRWLKHCALYPSWQLRLLKKGQVRYQKEGHGQKEVTSGPLHYIREPYNHYGFGKGIHFWVTRHNGYTTNELELVQRMADEPLRLSELASHGPVSRRRCMKRIAARMPCLRLLVFSHLYILKGGFLDGWPGFVFCLLRLANEIHLVAKLAERRFITARGSRSVKEEL